MDQYTCVTCSTRGNEADISKHLSSSRHKTVKYDYLDEIIECEECEDSNVHQLLVVRFGLSDMALLCQSCLSKDEKPSTQYSLSNGSFLKKVPQYFQFRDIECKDCENDKDLYVGNNKKTKSQIILCKNCLSKNEDSSIEFVSENDDNFLNVLLGIKEFIPPKNSGQRGRHRKVGRKGGKKGKGRKIRRAKPDAEERKAHYEKTKNASMAIKSGKTLLAIGSEKASPKSTNASSNSNTPRSTTPTIKGKNSAGNQFSKDLNKSLGKIGGQDTFKDKKGKHMKASDSTKRANSTGNKPQPRSEAKKSSHKESKGSNSKKDGQNKSINDENNTSNKEGKLKDKTSKNKDKKKGIVNATEKLSSEHKANLKSHKEVSPSKNTLIDERCTNKDGLSSEIGNTSDKTTTTSQISSKKKQTGKEETKGTNGDLKGKPKTTTKLKNNKESSNGQIKTKVAPNASKNKSAKSPSGLAKLDNKQKEKNNLISKAAIKNTPNTNQKNSKPSNDVAKTDLLTLPPGIHKYEPSAEPPLTYPDMNSYFKEMSYNLYLEERLGNLASNSDLSIDYTQMTIEWYADQDKKNKQFKITIPLTDEILNLFISKKMQSIRKTPFSLNQAIFLILNDEIPWYGQIVTVDSRSAQKGRKGGLKIFEMVVELYKWNDQPLPLSVNVKWLKLLPASIPVSRVFLAMSRIENPKFISMILGQQPIKQIVFKNYLRFTKETFNESQKVAIQSVLNNSITVLQGPPGTGKTSTIYEIILQLLENLNTFPILVVAASNIAIDNIAEKLLEKHGRSILRIVANEKEKEYNREHPLSSICLHHKVYDALPLAMKQTIDDMKRFNGPKVSQNQYKKLLSKQIELSDIFTAQAKVIFTTTVVAGGNQLKSVKKLPVVIMDEATQSSEPTTLIPLSMPGVEKFVFVGDQKQLSSFSQVPSLSLSLFERVLLNGTYKTPHMLDTQYRMHPAISDFPRKKFYGGLLKDGITEDDRKIENIPSNPIYVWDTCGKVVENRVKIRFREDRGYTYVNEGEVGLIQKVLLNLIYEKGISREDIGIITPYRGQRDLISSILVKDELVNPEKEDIRVEVDRDDIYNDSKPVTIHTVSDIMIASIDAFQGRERNFLIISCVRSNQENKIGFLNDERRLNVALTRAKYGLIIVGDVKCLSSGDDLWKEYLHDLSEKGCIHNNDEFMY